MAHDTTLMRKQVWESMFRARFSSVFYQLSVRCYRRWESIGKVAVVIVAIAAVSVTSAYPSEWSAIASTAVIPLIVAIGDILFSLNKRRDAEHCYERWSDLSHDLKSLWDRINAKSPKWSGIAQELGVLRERARSLEARDPQHPNRNRLFCAERIIYEELGLDYD